MSRSLYRALLLLYPKSFRTEYGQLMIQLFDDQHVDQGGRVWLTVLPDIVRTAPTQRIEALMHSRTARIALGATCVAVVSVVVTTGTGGLGVAAIAATILAALLLTQRRVIAAAPTGERAPLRHAVVQAWWAPIAALVGVVLLLGAIGTAFEAHNLGGRIFGTAILFAFGATMLLGLMRRPFARDAGNVMILVGTLPLFPFFWLVFPQIVGIVIWIGVFSSGFGDRIDVRGDPSRVM